MPFVSIIIPVYNGSNFLGKAIESAISQTYKNIEILVINDGSIDGNKTENIAKSYGKNIRYFKKKNGGVGSALNYGIKKMKGNWITWLSHDDFLYPTKIEEDVNIIKTHPTARVVMCNTGIIDGDSRIIRKKNINLPPYIHGASWTFRTWIYACALTINKNALKNTGYINEKNSTSQDTEMIMKLLDKYGIFTVPKLLTMRRDHDSNRFYQVKGQNLKDNNKLYQKLLKEKGIHFFYKGINKTSQRVIGLTYYKIGSNLFNISSSASNLAYKLSIETWSSRLNPSRIALSLNRKTIKKLSKNIRYIKSLFRYYAIKLLPQQKQYIETNNN